jgi:LmbE family N-acetylglucosaminyl deacetylase
MAISAHLDDIEIMAVEPILRCFQQPDFWFSAVVMSDGRGSPRDDLYKNYSDDEMRVVRIKEQKKASIIGEYTALVLLDYPSKAIKDPIDKHTIDDLLIIFDTMSPQFIYTHNLADKHDTHVSTALRVIEALRRLPAVKRPKKLYGCEVWRSLDWLLDSDKVAFDLGALLYSVYMTHKSVVVNATTWRRWDAAKPMLPISSLTTWILSAVFPLGWT